MKSGALNLLWRIAAGMMLALLIVYVAISAMNRFSGVETRAIEYMHQRDSLQAELSVLKQSYDSLIAVNAENERLYIEQLAADNQKMKQYKIKIQKYEQAIDAVDNLTDDELIREITEYYRKYRGYR